MKQDGYLSAEFRSVSLLTIDPNESLPFHIAIHYKGKMLIYRKPGQAFESDAYNKFLCHRITQVLIPFEDFSRYEKYVKGKELEKDALLGDPNKADDQRALSKSMNEMRKVADQLFSHQTDAELEEGVREAMKAAKNTVESVLAKPYVHIYDSLPSKSDSIIAHSARVSILATFLSYHLGFVNPYALEHVAAAALVHDIGKIRLGLTESTDEEGVPLEIDEEMMKQHPLVSCDILSKMNFVPEDVLRIVREHHECRDGSGYPHGLRGPKLSGLSKVFAIANTFDNLTSSNKSDDSKSRTMQAAKTMLVEMKSRFEPKLLAKALRLLTS